MNIVYLDNAATTKPDADIVSNAVRLTEEIFFNPSALYRGGMAAKKMIAEAREKIERLYFGKKVIFTSCGSESDNTAIFSFAKRGNIVTTKAEHSAVYNCCNALKQKGFDVRFASLEYGGAVNVDDLTSLVDENTTLVSVVHVVNETGAINDIEAIAAAVKKINDKVIFHSDGVQAFGKISSKLKNVDLYSVSAHKIGGLKGTGALIYNEKLRFQPYVFGGGQEEGLRSGTENVLGIKVFADCAEKYNDNLSEYFDRACECKKAFINALDGKYFKMISPENASPYVVSFSAVGLRGQVVQAMADDEGYIIGTGSACSSKNPHSRIISSFENDKNVLDGVLRVSFSPETKCEDVVSAAKTLNAIAEKLNYKIAPKRRA